MSLSRDTHPRAERLLVDGLRRMSGTERLGRAVALRESVLALARVRIRERYGAIPEREVRLRLAGLWLDRATLMRVFDWDPREKGF